jgi:hypothetical protein
VWNELVPSRLSTSLVRMAIVVSLLTLCPAVSADQQFTLTLRSGNGTTGSRDLQMGLKRGNSIEAPVIVGNPDYWGTINGAKWVSIARNARAKGPEIYEFYSEFSLPEDQVVSEASLDVEWRGDDLATLGVNGFLLDRQSSFGRKVPAGRQIVKPFDSYLRPGQNRISFFLVNSASRSNPTGLVFRATITYKLQQADPSWSPWQPLGGSVSGAPALVRNSDGRLELFATEADGDVIHNWQQSNRIDASWSGWYPLFKPPTTGRFEAAHAPAVGRHENGQLELFVLGTDLSVWHKIRSLQYLSDWSGWERFSTGTAASQITFLGDPVVVEKLDQSLEVFVRGFNGQIYSNQQVSPNAGWTGWSSLGGNFTHNPVVGVNKDGRLELFVRGPDDAVWHKRQDTQGWTKWESLGGSTSFGPAVGQNADGRLELFVRGADGRVSHNWQTGPNEGWSGWDLFSASSTEDHSMGTGSPVVGSNADGRLELFLRGKGQALYHTWQSVPSRPNRDSNGQRL